MRNLYIKLSPPNCTTKGLVCDMAISNSRTGNAGEISNQQRWSSPKVVPVVQFLPFSPTRIPDTIMSTGPKSQRFHGVESSLSTIDRGSRNLDGNQAPWV